MSAAQRQIGADGHPVKGARVLGTWKGLEPLPEKYRPRGGLFDAPASDRPNVTRNWGRNPLSGSVTPKKHPEGNAVGSPAPARPRGQMSPGERAAFHVALVDAVRATGMSRAAIAYALRIGHGSLAAYLVGTGAPRPERAGVILGDLGRLVERERDQSGGCN